MTIRTLRPRAVAAPLLATALRIGAAATGVAMCAVAMGGQTDLSTMPLITSAPQVVKPNLMFILDDSGSMAWTHMPDDAANFGQSGTGTKKYGYASAQCNGVYYNPNVFYRPGANADGTDMTSQTAANTANWTKVLTDPYLSFANTNLATGYPDRVWCTDQADAALSGNCRQNSAYQFPNFTFQYGRTGGGAVKTILGAPYYYRMQTAQFCNAAGSTCASGSGPRMPLPSY